MEIKNGNNKTAREFVRTKNKTKKKKASVTVILR
jgi:hypothetical protein